MLPPRLRDEEDMLGRVSRAETRHGGETDFERKNKKIKYHQTSMVFVRPRPELAAGNGWEERHVARAIARSSAPRPEYDWMRGARALRDVDQQRETVFHQLERIAFKIRENSLNMDSRPKLVESWTFCAAPECWGVYHTRASSARLTAGSRLAWVAWTRRKAVRARSVPSVSCISRSSTWQSAASSPYAPSPCGVATTKP